MSRGGFGNKISVSSERAQPTVPLYAEPRLGVEVAGMGVSGETHDNLACTTNSQESWCRVGHPGQSGRVLWVLR